MNPALWSLLLLSLLFAADALRIRTTHTQRESNLRNKKATEQILRQPSEPLSLTPLTSSYLPFSQRRSQRIFSDLSNGDLIGEDAATFDLGSQSLKDWGTFLVAVGGILSFLFYVWIYDGGPELGDRFKEIMESLAGGDTTLTITYMLAFFAVAHSGLASLRPAAEKIIGTTNFLSVIAFNRCYDRLMHAKPFR